MVLELNMYSCAGSLRAFNNWEYVADMIIKAYLVQLDPIEYKHLLTWDRTRAIIERYPNELKLMKTIGPLITSDTGTEELIKICDRQIFEDQLLKSIEPESSLQNDNNPNK